ncbi:MAG: heterodisulfide reductase-related iron-sulfur binding cluster [Candidatus Sericytochromatia bacterium]|nr:heterodisulfide reductase-related iron-sulfur binding cluster [Candidatus Sericytochromatia bacterium]
MGQTGEGASGLLDACIHCGLCLPRCPTYRETGDELASPRGRLHLMRALEEGRLTAEAEVREAFDGCVGCRACETACPAGVRYGALLEHARATWVEPARPATPAVRAWRRLAGSVLTERRLMGLGVVPGRLARRLLVRAGRAPAWLPGQVGRALELLPEGGLWPSTGLPEWTPAVGTERGVVAFLQGCAGAALYGEANAATVRLLARAGFRVWVPPGLGCCGALQLHEGDREGAIAQARANVAALGRHPWVALVSNAGGCGAALHDYAHLLPGDPEAQSCAARVVDLATFLGREGLPPPPASPTPRSVRVTWHDPCHLAHGLGVREAPRRLLAAMPGVTLVELPEADWCCGGAGSYTLKQPDMSDRLLATKLAHVWSTGAEVVVTANPPCLMQLGRGLAQQGDAPPVVHLASFLDGFWH